MKQLLSPVPQSPSVERSIRSLASGKMDRDEAADWLDDYFLAGAFAAEDHERTLHIIRKHSLPLSGDSPFALKKAMRQIAIATAAGNVPAWREAVAWMASDANSFLGLNASDLGIAVKHIRFLSVEKALSSLPVAVSAASRSQGNPFAGFGLNLALGNTLAALGSFTEAARFFMLALNSEVAATIRQIDRRSIAIVLQRALCGMWSGEDPQHMAVEFRDFLTDEDPDVVVAFRYFRYLAGFSTVTGTDVIIPPPAISHQVSLFHELCHHLEQDGDAALKSVQELVASSLDCFELGSLQAPPNTFPVLRPLSIVRGGRAAATEA
ncbi:MAG UNVERIFIED_CONTAM: hypothetical protein LVR18_44225 [Planctomycetaceae bacterium]